MTAVGQCFMECYIGPASTDEIFYTQGLKPYTAVLDPYLTYYKITDCVDCLAQEYIGPFLTSTARGLLDLPCELENGVVDSFRNPLITAFVVGVTAIFVYNGLQLMSRTWSHYSNRPREIISHV